MPNIFSVQRKLAQAQENKGMSLALKPQSLQIYATKSREGEINVLQRSFGKFLAHGTIE